MSEHIKLLLAIDQVDNLTSLLEGNEYQQFFYSHLISIQTELKRQLTCIKHSAKIKE
jgi:sRNA-binding regulator protein Hfq